MQRRDERLIQIIGQEPERKRPCRRFRRTWENIIKKDLRMERCGLGASGSG
jgi:hypothetical protein